MIPTDPVPFADDDKRKALRDFLQAALAMRVYVQQAKDYSAAGTMTITRANAAAQAFDTLRSKIDLASPENMPELAAYAQAQLPDFIKDYAADHKQVLAEAEAARDAVLKYLNSVGLKDRVLTAQETTGLREDLDKPVVADAAVEDAALKT